MESQIIISGLNFPEGPAFDTEGNLWFVEIKGGNLSRWDGMQLRRFVVKGTPNGMAFDRHGAIWFCDSERGEIRVFDPVDQSIKTVCNSTVKGPRLKRPNDLVFDIDGNLLFSDHADGRTEPISTICVLPKGSNMSKVISDQKYFTNGLAFGADAKTLIFSETYRQQLWIAEWDSLKLELKNERPFAKAGDGPWGPDGIAFDRNEKLYAAVFNESKINIYEKNGVMSGTLPCPGTRPTSCAFDPSGQLGLVVTEADRGQIISYPDIRNGLPIFN